MKLFNRRINRKITCMSPSDLPNASVEKLNIENTGIIFDETMSEPDVVEPKILTNGQSTKTRDSDLSRSGPNILNLNEPRIVFNEDISSPEQYLILDSELTIKKKQPKKTKRGTPSKSMSKNIDINLENVKQKIDAYGNYNTKITSIKFNEENILKDDSLNTELIIPTLDTIKSKNEFVELVDGANGCLNKNVMSPRYSNNQGDAEGIIELINKLESNDGISNFDTFSLIVNVLDEDASAELIYEPTKELKINIRTPSYTNYDKIYNPINQFKAFILFFAEKHTLEFRINLNRVVMKYLGNHEDLKSMKQIVSDLDNLDLNKKNFKTAIEPDLYIFSVLKNLELIQKAELFPLLRKYQTFKLQKSNMVIFEIFIYNIMPLLKDIFYIILYYLKQFLFYSIKNFTKYTPIPEVMKLLISIFCLLKVSLIVLKNLISVVNKCLLLFICVLILLRIVDVLMHTFTALKNSFSSFLSYKKKQIKEFLTNINVRRSKNNFLRKTRFNEYKIEALKNLEIWENSTSEENKEIISGFVEQGNLCAYLTYSILKKGLIFIKTLKLLVSIFIKFVESEPLIFMNIFLIVLMSFYLKRIPKKGRISR